MKLKDINLNLATKQATARYNGQNERGQYDGTINFAPAENIDGFTETLAGIGLDMVAFTPQEGEKRKIIISPNFQVKIIEGKKVKKIDLDDPEISTKQPDIVKSLEGIKKDRDKAVQVIAEPEQVTK